MAISRLGIKTAPCGIPMLFLDGQEFEALLRLADDLGGFQLLQRCHHLRELRIRFDAWMQYRSEIARRARQVGHGFQQRHRLGNFMCHGTVREA